MQSLAQTTVSTYSSPRTNFGKDQIRAGKVNPRTAMWVSVFEKWEKAGI